MGIRRARARGVEGRGRCPEARCIKGSQLPVQDRIQQLAAGRYAHTRDRGGRSPRGRARAPRGRGRVAFPGGGGGEKQGGKS